MPKSGQLEKLLSGLSEVKQAAEVMEKSIGQISGDRARLTNLEESVVSIEKQLESLEYRYIELLYSICELKANR